MICPNCGTELTENSLFCNICGTKIENSPRQPVISPPIADTSQQDYQMPQQQEQRKATLSQKILLAILIIIAIDLIGGIWARLYMNHVRKEMGITGTSTVKTETVIRTGEEGSYVLS